MKNKLFRTLSVGTFAFILFGCGSKTDPNPSGGGTGTGLCQLSNVSSSDGSSESYTYNGKQRWENVTLSDGKTSTTFNLAYDNIQTDGPVVYIGNKAIKAITILDYTKDNLLKTANTTIPEKDGGIILGKPVKITNLKIDQTFEWNTNSQLVRINYKTNQTVTTNGVSSDFPTSIHQTFEYNSTGDLIRQNSYSDLAIVIGTVLKPAGSLDAYYTYEYESNIPEVIQDTSIKGVDIFFSDDGQISCSPKSKKAIKKLTAFYSDTKGGFDQSITNYTNTVNSSGFLIKTVGVYKSSTETFTYTYNNCK